jgi:hypothetical protein
VADPTSADDAADAVRVEFTIEPFVDGRPGPHVTAAVEAAEGAGATVELGPFGSSCSVPAAAAADVVGRIVDAALGHGATHIALHLERPAVGHAAAEP